MALRTPLSVTPHLYMGDSTGRPLDKGVVYFGEQDKDPEFYPINLFSDDALTKPLAQPVHTKGGYLYDKGDMVEPHAKELIYSVKVLDSYGRKVLYKGAMMRNSWNDDVIEQINTAIIESQAEAQVIFDNAATDVKNKAIAIVNDAINNTAVEGGVLADTFVTATPKGIGAVARTQRDINSEKVSVKDFGAVGDGVTDDTDAFLKAISTNSIVYVPKGVYKLYSNNLPLQENGSLILVGEEGSEVLIDKGTHGNLFRLPKNFNEVVIEGVSFKNIYEETDPNEKIIRFFTIDPSGLYNLMAFYRCKFEEPIAVLINSFSYTQNPIEEPFGIKRIYVENCEFKNVQRFISIGNSIVEDGRLVGNYVQNLGDAFLTNTVVNGITYDYELSRNGSWFVHQNTFINDDDFWAEPASAYLSPVVLETYRLVFTENFVKGLKTNKASSLTTVVLFYASCTEVIAKNNTYKNSANFEPSNINALFIAKSSGLEEEHLIFKHVCNNVFCMDKTWLESFPTYPEISHYLFNFGISPTGVVSYGSFVEFSDNYIKLGTLMSSFRNVYQEFICQNNTIIANNIAAQPVTASLFTLFSMSSGASTGESTIFNITNNHIVLRDYDPDLSISLFSISTEELANEFHELTVTAGLVNIKDNTVNVNTYHTSTNRFVSYGLAAVNEAVIQGNIIKAPLSVVILGTSGVGELIHTNNRYISPAGINEISLSKELYVVCYKRRIEDNIFNGFSLDRYDSPTLLDDSYQSTLNSFGIKGHTLSYEIHSPELKTSISTKGVFDYTNGTYTANSESPITVSKLVINEEYNSTNPESVPLISTEVTENETTETVYEEANRTHTDYRYNLGDSYRYIYALVPVGGISHIRPYSIKELGKDIRLVHTMNPF